VTTIFATHHDVGRELAQDGVLTSAIVTARDNDKSFRWASAFITLVDYARPGQAAAPTAHAHKPQDRRGVARIDKISQLSHGAHACRHGCTAGSRGCAVTTRTFIIDHRDKDRCLASYGVLTAIHCTKCDWFLYANAGTVMFGDRLKSGFPPRCVAQLQINIVGPQFEGAEPFDTLFVEWLPDGIELEVTIETGAAI
jgi:hypothetical protein